MGWTKYFRRARWDEERQRELEAYLENETEDNVARGMSPEEARYAARRKLGNTTRIREEIYRMNSLNFVESLWQDVRCGFRMLRNNASFAIIAVLTLGLGIGANTAIFSVVHAVLLSPLPYDHPERIMLLLESNPSKGFPQFAVAPPNYMDWRNTTKSFEAMASIERRAFNFTGGTEPERLTGARVGASFFSVFGAKPALGRDFVPEDDLQGTASVVVLSYGLWTRHFGSDPQIIGKSLTLDSHSYRVIGIMRSDFQFPRGIELWLPSEFTNDDLGPGARGAHYLRVVARLKPEVNLQQAQAEMEGLSKRLEQQYPRTNAGWTARVVSLNQATVGDVRRTLLILFGAVGFLLLIACANVANLLLARASARQKEFAIRYSLGAARLRIARQLLTESIVLSGIAGAFGLLLAEWAIRALRALPPSNLPRATAIQLDWTVLGFTAGIAVLTGAIFGLAPALHITRAAPSETLKEGGRASSAGRHGVRSALVVLETTLALVLLVGSGLLLKSFLRLQSVDLGFQSKNILTGNVVLPSSKYSTPEQRVQFYQQVADRMQSVPGVGHFALASGDPIEGENYSFAFATKELEALAPADQPSAGYYMVSPSYFKTLGIPLLAGRTFTREDSANSPPVAIISQMVARRFFPDRNPIGQQIFIGAGPGKVWREIVGVVGDVKDEDPGEEGSLTLYAPFTQMAWDSMTLFLRADGDVSQMAGTMRSAVMAVDKDQPVADLATGDELMSRAVAQPQLRTLLLGLFAGLALVLASLGIYGVMSSAVAQRTQEIGVRMALGAERRSVLQMVLGQGLRLTLAGIVLGTAGAIGLTGLMKSLLFHVKPTDPATFVAVTLFLLAVALLAIYIPARRATHVDPVVALRYE
ncbi:MAG TPA: ABC transporter permease [Candidatus Methylomirabilis sp.]|nr:ABC transporter permease [Candidatus Methylomirabilis sp.]